VQVVVFAVLIMPVAAFGFYQQRNDDEADKEAKVREVYSADIAAGQERTDRLKAYLVKTIINNNPDEGDEERFRDLLRGGKGDKKLVRNVDADLYGTERGVEEKKRMEEELKREALERKERRNKRRQQGKKEGDGTAEAEEAEKAAAVTAESASKGEPWIQVDAKQVITVATVGTVAAVVGFLFGGGRAAN
jgi:hypothetical protein